MSMGALRAAAAALPVPTLEQVDAAICGRSLREFVRAAWSELEPDTPLKWNWHLDAICDHLEAVSRGQIRNLLVNIPPGCMKSMLVSVLWPAWEWATRPELRYLCASYDQALATRDNRRVRDLVQSEWYRARWPHVRISDDQNQKTRFDTTAGGWRIGTSVGGRATGEHPHRKIVDDPHTPSQSLSEAERAEVRHWFDNTLSTRGVALGAATVVIMQRLHEQDLSGHILDGGGFVHLCLPMRWEPGRMVATPLGWQDPREKAGELLWPEMFPGPVVDELVRTRLGSVGEAGQLQQRPAPSGGGMFRREWFRLAALPEGVRRWCRFWDCAGTEEKPGTDPDWTVGTLIGEAGGVYYVADVIRLRASAASVDAAMFQAAQTDPPGTLIREEQEPGSSGKAVIAAHARMLAGRDYAGVPATGEKTTRWRPFVVQAEAGNVRLVPDAEGKPRPWVQAWLDELSLAPFGRHDDQADSAAGAFSALALGPRPVTSRPVLWG